MYYYQLLFNIPVNTSYTYASQEELLLYTRVEVNFGGRKKEAFVESQTSQSDIDKLLQKKITLKEIIRTIDISPVLNYDQVELAKWMSDYYFTSFGVCIFSMLSIAKREKSHNISTEIVSAFTDTMPTLTSEQSNAVDIIVESAFANKKDSIHHFLLYGLTGSGKTEVFLQIAQAFVKKQLQVIYLVPEISLTKQLYPLFCSRFGKDVVAVLHSGLTKSQRLKEWNRIMNAEAKIVLGARSAVFAPVKNLGIILIDEEHDVSYKSSDTSPRYNAKQIAYKRAELHQKRMNNDKHKIPVVLGSATPCLETWFYAQQKTCTLLSLSKRVAGGELPKIKLATLNNVKGCLSYTLSDYMKETLHNGHQVLLLLNKRGYSRTFVCTQCGYTLQCPNCSVNLVFHRINGKENLQCHHCGFCKDAPNACPQCQYTSLGLKGWGTQRVVDDVTQLFPQYVVDRFDSDVLKDDEQAKNVLKNFYEQKTHILVGTQMLAKGANFPKLQLVGVLCADTHFTLPDFRSSERTYSLFMQAAGRAGRFLKNGKVVIQAYSQEHPTLSFITSQKPDNFYAQELERRKGFSLIPYVRMLRIVFKSENEEKLHKFAHYFTSALQKNLLEGCTILGPSACALQRIANRYRAHVILSSKTQSKISAVLRQTLEKTDVQKKAKAQKIGLEINPDPQSIM